MYESKSVGSKLAFKKIMLEIFSTIKLAYLSKIVRIFVTLCETESFWKKVKRE
jgi:hypothetical protein